MEKPIQLKLEETRTALVSVVNDSQIPFFCLTPILKEIYEQSLSLEKQEYSKAKQQYEDELAKDNNGNTDQTVE